MTTFDEIIERALVICNDYKLGKLYNNDEDAFKQYCDGFVKSAISEFYQCNQSLTYDVEDREFDVTLTPLEQEILAEFWVIKWWQRETNNAAQIALKLKVSASFSYNSESQNFKEKQNIIDKLQEEVNRKISAYEMQSLDSLY